MIQIDIDIPKTCDDCSFHVYHSGKNYVCVATPLFYPMNLANYKDGRKDFCPLIEVTQEPIDYKAQYEKFSKKSKIVISQLRSERDRLLESFDKIRAEIESIDLLAEYTRGDIKRMALDVIDKYKAESEQE